MQAADKQIETLRSKMKNPHTAADDDSQDLPSSPTASGSASNLGEPGVQALLEVSGPGPYAQTAAPLLLKETHRT